MIRASVKVFDRFPQLTERVERAARNVTQQAAEEALEVARRAGAERGLTDVELLQVRPSVDGYVAGIRGRWYYRFQSDGTLGNAIRAKKPGRKRSHAPGTGITPNRMFQQARAAGRLKLRRIVGR